MRPCPNQVCDKGVVHDTKFYREPPPGDAVWEKGYHPASGSKLARVPDERSCIRCGGRGEISGSVPDAE